MLSSPVGHRIFGRNWVPKLLGSAFNLLVSSVKILILSTKVECPHDQKQNERLPEKWALHLWRRSALLWSNYTRSVETKIHHWINSEEQFRLKVISVSNFFHFVVVLDRSRRIDDCFAECPSFLQCWWMSSEIHQQLKLFSEGSPKLRVKTEATGAHRELGIFADSMRQYVRRSFL